MNYSLFRTKRPVRNREVSVTTGSTLVTFGQCTVVSWSRGLTIPRRAQVRFMAIDWKFSFRHVLIQSAFAWLNVRNMNASEFDQTWSKLVKYSETPNYLVKFWHKICFIGDSTSQANQKPTTEKRQGVCCLCVACIFR